MKTQFDLEVNGFADDTAYVKIVTEKETCKSYILFSSDNLLQPDFILKGDELEEFAANILQALSISRLYIFPKNKRKIL